MTRVPFLLERVDTEETMLAPPRSVHAPRDQPLPLLGVCSLKLLDRFFDRGLRVGGLDMAEEPPTLADQPDFPGVHFLRWFLRGHQLEHSTGSGATPTL